MSLAETIVMLVKDDIKASILFSEGGKDYIKKYVNGEWVCKEAIKDPNYNGHRYIWQDEI